MFREEILTQVKGANTCFLEPALLTILPSSCYCTRIMLIFIHCSLIKHNQMAVTVPQIFKNLPANGIEMSTLQELIDGDLEFRTVILRRQGELQSRSSYPEKAAPPRSLPTA